MGTSTVRPQEKPSVKAEVLPRWPRGVRPASDKGQHHPKETKYQRKEELAPEKTELPE